MYEAIVTTFVMYTFRVAVKHLFSEEESKLRPRKGGSHSSHKRASEREEEEEEDGYFSTYSHFAIHEEMLKVCVCNMWAWFPQYYSQYT